MKKATNHKNFTKEHIIWTVNELYKRNLAELWFIGCGWPEGHHYCQNAEYLQVTGADVLYKNNWRACWFAYLYLQR